jgi:hypothetical protein
MTIQKKQNHIQKFSDPGIYQIEALGHLPHGFSDRVRGMQIIPKDIGADMTIFILTGQISDQIALAGILDALFDMHMVLLSLKLIEN